MLESVTNNPKESINFWHDIFLLLLNIYYKFTEIFQIDKNIKDLIYS